MATYRLIHREAETGDRSSALTDFEFCVWISYQLAADDFGVCPATAAKLQGESPRLEQKPAKVVQQAIERLIELRLCGVFTDGARRYLYQPDWQDWQRLKHASATSHPPVPAELLEQCSTKTRALFADFHPKVRARLAPHARACDAPATADAPADASAGGAGGAAAVAATPRPPKLPPGRPGLLTSPGRWGVEHSDHVEGFCDFVCFPGRLFREFVTRVRAAGADPEQAEAQVREWALAYRASFQGIPGDSVWDFWKHAWSATHGSNKPAARARGHAAGIDALIAQGRTPS